MKDLSKYEATFGRSPMGTWFWQVKTPGDGVMRPIFGGVFMNKENAEKDALRRIEIHASRETVDGAALQRRVEQSTGDGAPELAKT
jgi:hypothetical protein